MSASAATSPSASALPTSPLTADATPSAASPAACVAGCREARRRCREGSSPATADGRATLQRCDCATQTCESACALGERPVFHCK